MERGIPTKRILERSRETSTIQIRKALPVDFRPRLQSLLFILAASVLPRFRFLTQWISRYLYYTLVMDNAVPMGYLQDFQSLATPARRAAKRLQTSAAAISDSMASTALIALRREYDGRATEFGTIGDQLVMAADMRPKRFRTKLAACDLRRAHSPKGRGSCRTRSLDSTSRELAQVNGYANGEA